MTPTSMGCRISIKAWSKWRWLPSHLTASPTRHHLCILLDAFVWPKWSKKDVVHLSSNPAKRCPVWAPFIHENTPVGRSTVGTDDQFTLWKHRWVIFPEFVERSPFLIRESLERQSSLRRENCDENDPLNFGWRLDLSFGWRAWNNLPTRIDIAGFQVYPCRLQNSCGLDLLKSVHWDVASGFG